MECLALFTKYTVFSSFQSLPLELQALVTAEMAHTTCQKGLIHCLQVGLFLNGELQRHKKH